MKSPFKFLDSYTRDDREIFFGREREIEELYHRVFESKIMLVYGVSGTGKSSLIHCGLANKFSETDWLPLVIRRGSNIIESLAGGIRAASLTEQQGRFSDPADFKKGVRSLYLDHYKPVFFIFDQFEELFIFGDREERRTFIRIVKTLTESDLQCRFIFVMREEYMATISEFEKYIHTIFSNRVRIEKMSHMNALEAIKGPCNVFNITLEEGFAETLLEKLSPGSEDVELTYLQVFLDKIFRLSTGSLPPPGGKSKGGLSLFFTLSLLSRIGNVSDLLGSFLDDQIALMEDPETAMTVLKAFVSGKGTKRPANEQEAIDNIRSFGKEMTPETIKELIQAFVNLRLLREKDESERYELRHDALAEKVYDKFSTAEKELLEIRQFIESSYQSYLKRNILLSDDDINFISDKDSLLSLNPELQEFLKESRKHRQAKIRVVRRLTIASFISFLIMTGILGYFIMTKITETKADYEAIKMMTSSADPQKKLKIASEMWKNNPGAIQKEALLKTFNDILQSTGNDSTVLSLAAHYKLRFDQAPSDIQYASCSMDNKYIFGYGDSLIFIWTLQGKLEKIIRTEHYPIIGIRMSENSQFIGAVGSDSILTVWEINGKEQFAVKIQYNNVNDRQIFRFTGDDHILSLMKGSDAVLLNEEGKTEQVFNRHSGRVNAVDISPDNRFIATASSDSTINIWYYNTAKKRYDYYNAITWHSDTVWSVSFSKTNVNIISTSSDSCSSIGNINNEKIFHEYLYYKYERLGSCYAEFTPSDSGIIIISQSYSNPKINKMTYAFSLHNPKIYLNNRAGDDFWDVPSMFSGMVFSADESYYACTENDKVFLVDNILAIERNKLYIKSTYTLMEFTGKNPVFSADSKYFLYSDGKNIRALFIDIESICKLASEIPE